MASTTPIRILITTDETQAVSGVKRVDAEVSGFAGHMGHYAARITEYMAATFAVEKIVEFGKGAIEGALDQQAAERITEQAIKSTGNAANVSGKQITEYADSLSNLTGIDDDAVRGAENLLLTFTNVQNKAGDGNDIFRQATAATLDMATAFHEDANSAAIQLGKALNDPVAGATALRRVGVQLTDQQQEQIKAFVKSGDIMSAQKVILGELGKETGGAAAAAADPWKKFTVTMQNFQKQIGAELLPVLTPFVSFIGTELPKAITYVKEKWAEWQPQIDRFVSQVREQVMPILQEFGAWVKTEMPVISQIFQSVIAIVTLIWNNFGTQIMQVVHGAFEFMKAEITLGLNIIRDVINLVLAVLSGDWSGAWNAIKQIVIDVWHGIVGMVSGSLQGIAGILSGAGKIIAGAAGGMWDGIKDAFRAALNWIIDKWNGLHFKVPSMDLGPLGKIGGFDVGLGHINTLYTGGVGKGWSWVGERGPELVNFGSPSRVLNHRDSIAASGGSNTPTVIHFEPSYNINAPIYGVDDLQRLLDENNKKQSDELLQLVEAL